MRNLVVHRSEHVLTIRINRPQVRNALDPETYYELSCALDEFEADDDIWLGVLTGTGAEAFSAGRDLKQLAAAAQATPEERSAEAELWSKTTRLTDRFGLAKPLIAKLNGSAYGGGFELALACDIIVAADHVEFGLPEPRRGLIATAGGVHRLPRQLPLKTAMGLMLTGRSLTASRAFELGLVNEVVPASELDAATDRWIADILRCAPLAVRATKQCAMQGLGASLAEAMTRSYEWEERRLASEDSKEGPRAFAEKRPPRWIGR